MRDPNKDKYDSTFIQQWINEAEQLFCTNVNIHFKVDTDITTAAGENEYDLPDDYESDIAVWYNDEYELKETSYEETIDYTGSPAYYYIKNDEKLGIPGTIPDGKTIRFIYYSIGGKMTDPAHVPVIPKKYHLALVFLACYLCCLEGDDSRQETFWGGFVRLTNIASGKDTEDRYGNDWPVIGDSAADSMLFQELDIDSLYG